MGTKGVLITKCVFFISKTHGFLGARPDGIITDQEESTPGVVEFKYIQVKPGETLTDILLRQHKVQHKDNEIIQLNQNPKYYLQLYQQMFVTEYHWGVLVDQGSNGDLFYEKVNFTENLWSPLLYRKFLVSCPSETLTDVLLRRHICLKVQHKENEIIQLNKTTNITYSCTSKCLSQKITGEFL